MKKIKWYYKALINSAAGISGLICFNFFGGLIGVTIGINIVTWLCVAVLGMPGFAMLLFLKLFL